MISRDSSLEISTPAAFAASRYQLDRQLRQKPARFIRSMFCTSVRSRRCCTRVRNAAASSSVRVASSRGMVLPQYAAEDRFQIVNIQDFAISVRQLRRVAGKIRNCGGPCHVLLTRESLTAEG